MSWNWRKTTMKHYEIYLYTISKNYETGEILQKRIVKKAYTNIGLLLKVIFYSLFYDDVDFSEEKIG